MSKPRFRDTFWIRISLMIEPGFLPGAPWRMAPAVFARLEAAGFVTKREHGNTLSAVGTDRARQHIETIRTRNLARLDRVLGLDDQS